MKKRKKVSKKIVTEMQNINTLTIGVIYKILGLIFLFGSKRANTIGWIPEVPKSSGRLFF